MDIGGERVTDETWTLGRADVQDLVGLKGFRDVGIAEHP